MKKRKFFFKKVKTLPESEITCKVTFLVLIDTQHILPLLSANHMLWLLLAVSWGMAFFPFSKPLEMS